MENMTEQAKGHKEGAILSGPPREATGGIIDEMQKHAQTIPIMFRNLFVKATKKTASPRQAIKAKCQECVGYEEVFSRVSECHIKRCPLNAYRPYQDKTEAEN